MREFAQGRWTNHTTRTKDLWIQENFATFVQERVRIETNAAYQKAGVNEFGENKRIKKRFKNHRDCATSYKNLFCWSNFPRCDLEKQLTLPMCESSCRNFFKACSYKPDLIRCGRTEYFNGHEPESPATVDANGSPVYVRDYFPGQPWIPNKFSQGGHELPVCTPAVDGSAINSINFNFNFHAFLILIFTIISILLYPFI